MRRKQQQRMYLRHGAVVPHRVPISAQWRMNFWAAGVRVVSDFRAYAHFCNFYLFRNYQMNRTVVKRFLGKTVCCAITSLGSFGVTPQPLRVTALTASAYGHAFFRLTGTL